MPGQKILVIDDELVLRMSLAAMLSRRGYLVDAAGSVQQAWEFLKAGSYDLVLLDLKMPGEGGMGLLPEITRQFPQTAVVILSAHATLDSTQEAARSGARDYLLKPIDPERLIQRVGEILAEPPPAAPEGGSFTQIQDLMGGQHHIKGNPDEP